MKSFAAFKEELLKDPAVKTEYDQLGPEIALAEAPIKARTKKPAKEIPSPPRSGGEG
jgi:hypothetical protein